MFKHSKQKARRQFIINVIITYLAVSKVLYWVDMIAGLDGTGFGAVAHGVFMRLLDRDLIMITIIILITILSAVVDRKSKAGEIQKLIFVYIIMYIAMIGLYYGYVALLNLFIHVEFAPLGGLMLSTAQGYVAIIVFFTIKDYLKKKADKELAADPADGELTMAQSRIAILQTLLDDGILTQDEFNDKSAYVMDIVDKSIDL